MASKNKDIGAAAQWLTEWVIGLNLCPFAKIPYEKGRIRLIMDDCEDPYDGLAKLLAEAARLGLEKTQTTLIVYSNSGPFSAFEDFMDFCAAANALLVEEGLDNEIQLAYFHPDFIFDGAEPTDPANAVSQSPSPILHLLKTADVEEAIRQHPNTASISTANMEKLRKRAEKQKTKA